MSLDVTRLLAAARYDRGININEILLEVVAGLRRRSVVVGGVLQEAERTGDGFCASLSVVDIQSGEVARITENRGKDARGCKLDPRGLASIGHCIEDAIDAKVDLIVINRFGRAECEGRGLLPYISDAITAGIPVLTAVRQPYIVSWRKFHAGLATELAPSVEPILEWCKTSWRCSSSITSVGSLLS